MSTTSPLPPGWLIKEALADVGLGISETASRLKINRPNLSHVLNHKSALTRDLAYRIDALINSIKPHPEGFFHMAKVWMELQAEYDWWREEDQREAVRHKALGLKYEKWHWNGQPEEPDQGELLT